MQCLHHTAPLPRAARSGGAARALAGAARPAVLPGARSHVAVALGAVRQQRPIRLVASCSSATE
ncbi:hypothetical protein MNEG_16164, partial [Monoraphidium neglectum]